jgi:hypothetical protein
LAIPTPFDAVARWWAVLDFKGCLEGNQSPQASANSLERQNLILGCLLSIWPAPGSEDTELGVLMELEVGDAARSSRSNDQTVLVASGQKRKRPG